MPWPPFWEIVSVVSNLVLLIILASLGSLGLISASYMAMVCDLEQSIDVSEFASLDPSLPHGLGLYKVVTVGFVVCGHGEPHEQV